jgi:hypothetical protein
VSRFNLAAALEHKDSYSNGVRLRTTKAELVKEKERTLVRVHWAIDYKGERWPLVILTPSLTNPTEKQTKVTLVAAGKGGEAFAWSIYSPGSAERIIGPFETPKTWYSTIEKERATAVGTIDIPFDWFKERLTGLHSKHFDERRAPPIYVLFEHNPDERGYEHDLDGWTGFLMAAPVRIPIKEW